MSGFIGKLSPQVVTGAQQALGMAGGALSLLELPLTAVLRMGRSFGIIVPDVTIEEHHDDRMEITVHPVANNATISDHAFKQPASVTMKCGWTNANPIGGLVEGVTDAITGAKKLLGGTASWSDFPNPFNSVTETRTRDVYNRLLALQNTREPFKLSTGKRLYKNMLIAGISVTTDRASEYALMVEVHFQEVIIVSTSTKKGAATGQGPSAAPQTTDAPTEVGPVQPQGRQDTPLKKLTGMDNVNINPLKWLGIQ